MDGQSSSPPKSSRLGPVLFIGLIVGPLIYAYGSYAVTETLRSCVQRGPPDSSAKTPLQQAQQLGSCVDKNLSLAGRLFFEPTQKMLRSLPNAPSRFQGQWLSQEYGNPVEFHLCADSRVRVRPQDPTADDSWRGSWGVHEDHLLWFRNDRGPVLPAASFRLESGDADHFRLIDDKKEVQVFERAGARADCDGRP